MCYARRNSVKNKEFFLTLAFCCTVIMYVNAASTRRTLSEKKEDIVGGGGWGVYTRAMVLC